MFQVFFEAWIIRKIKCEIKNNEIFWRKITKYSCVRIFHYRYIFTFFKLFLFIQPPLRNKTMEGLEMIKKSEELEFLLDIHNTTEELFGLNPCRGVVRWACFLYFSRWKSTQPMTGGTFFFIGKQTSMRRRIRIAAERNKTS